LFQTRNLRPIEPFFNGYGELCVNSPTPGYVNTCIRAVHGYLKPIYSVNNNIQPFEEKTRAKNDCSEWKQATQNRLN